MWSLHVSCVCTYVNVDMRRNADLDLLMEEYSTLDRDVKFSMIVIMYVAVFKYHYVSHLLYGMQSRAIRRYYSQFLFSCIRDCLRVLVICCRRTLEGRV